MINKSLIKIFNFPKHFINSYIQIILEIKSFIIIGIFSTLINYSLFIFLYINNLNYLISGIFGFFAGAIFSFFMNRKITFKSKINPLKGLVLYFIIQGFSLSGHSLAQFSSTYFLEINKIYSQFFGIFFSTCLNFILMKWFLFRNNN